MHLMVMVVVMVVMVTHFVEGVNGASLCCRRLMVMIVMPHFVVELMIMVVMVPHFFDKGRASYKHQVFHSLI